MKTFRAARIIVPLAVASAALLGGCAQVEEKARDAVSEAASAGAREVQERACALAEDGLISAREMEALSGLVPAARTAGVPDTILAPLERITEAGDNAPDGAIDDLRRACGQTAEPSAG